MMAQQILGALGRPWCAQVSGRADHHEAKCLRQSNLHHLALDGSAQPHADVVAFRDDVGRARLASTAPAASAISK